MPFTMTKRSLSSAVKFNILQFKAKQSAPEAAPFLLPTASNAMVCRKANKAPDTRSTSKGRGGGSLHCFSPSFRVSVRRCSSCNYRKDLCTIVTGAHSGDHPLFLRRPHSTKFGLYSFSFVKVKVRRLKILDNGDRAGAMLRHVIFVTYQGIDWI